MIVPRRILIGLLLVLGQFNLGVARDFIVLMDGTGNAPPPSGKTTETNVWRLAKLLGVQATSQGPKNGWEYGTRNADATRPWVMYVYGVGTEPGSLKKQTLEYAFGGAVGKIVERTYTNLENSGITAGDHVLLFGFSRGAASVRLLANEINDRKLNHHPATIRFMGIWDTVAAIGIPMPKAEFERESIRKDFPQISAELTIPPIVKHVVHLVALDEQRSAFWPTLVRAADPSQTSVDEVWFAGDHCDIGGGWTEEDELRNTPPFRLWQVTLEYMLRAPHGVKALEFESAGTHVDRFRVNSLAAGKVHGSDWLLNLTELAAGKRCRNFREVLESSGLPTGATMKVHRSVQSRIDTTKDSKEPYQPQCLEDPARFEWYSQRIVSPT